MDITNISATALGAAIGEGTVTASDATQAYLNAIAAHPNTPDIYATITTERTLKEAAEADKRMKAGSRLGPLDGVPISWKDLFDSAKTPTEAGSKLLEGRVPDTDCALLDRATKAGLVCLGKTHMSELAFSGLGVNPMTATPPNANIQGAAPGGSSSGAAASVAFGLAAAAMGSDTGGSIRIPSAWNDLVGFKPVHGHLSLRGVVPLCPRFDTAGPLTKSVEDAEHIYHILAGTAPKPVDPAGGTLRLAVLETSVLDDLDPQIAAGFERAIKRADAAGITLSHIKCDAVAEALSLSAILFTTEAYGTWKHRIEAAPDKMFHEILERFRSGAHHSGADYVKAWQDLLAYRNIFKNTFANFDAVIMPSSPIMPPDRNRLDKDTEYYKRSNLLALRNTRVGNLMGSSAISLPGAAASVGTMLVDPQGRADALLAIAKRLEPVLRG